MLSFNQPSKNLPAESKNAPNALTVPLPSLRIPLPAANSEPLISPSLSLDQASPNWCPTPLKLSLTFSPRDLVRLLVVALSIAVFSIAMYQSAYPLTVGIRSNSLYFFL